jgi:membrane-associated phospholipid phosphatase
MKQLFKLETKIYKGLFAAEWAMLAYWLLTTLIIVVCYTKVQNPEAMLWGRVRILFTTAALYAVYRMLPCRLTRLARIGVQLAFLSWWYPDTYELNRMLPNLDHVFATWEQQLFGCQPALLFSQLTAHLPTLVSNIFSELMDLGYASYYPMIATVIIYYFFFRYKEFQRAAFIVLAAFFIFYVVFIVVPVTGPTFYYQAVGIDNIAQGIFPNLGSYFNLHQECMPSPGYTDGIFYHLVENAKAAGERPTAAFPSSHVGISTILMFLAWHTRERRLFFVLLPFFVLLCFSTVYIQAHYAIDALAGLLSGTIIYYVLFYLTRKSI